MIRLHHGDPHMIDHTPEAAVTAGDIVMLGNIACIAHRDIAAGAKGAIAFPSGHASYKGTLKTSAVLVAGDSVYGDVATNVIDPAEDVFLGYAVEAADETGTDTEGYFVHCLQTNVAS